MPRRSILEFLRRAMHLHAAPSSVQPSTFRCAVITADDEFSSFVMNAASTYGWTVYRARSIEEGLHLLQSGDIPMAIYDCEDDWRDALDRLCSLPAQPCVLVASPFADQNLRDAVVRHHGYDLIAKSADRDRLLQQMRFAWFWKKHSARHAEVRP